MEQQISKWLKKLERESWQLELLVSGFTIFLLIGAYDELVEFTQDFRFHNEGGSGFYLMAILLLYTITKSTMVLTFNLIMHLILRGFWIGAIGLRSVGPSIDYQRLKYHEFYIDKLKRKMSSMDHLIVGLDRLCSVIFSFSFLIIFLFLSLCLFLLSFGIVSWIFDGFINILPSVLSNTMEIIKNVVLLLILLGGMVYMFDSLSLGLVKKIGWLRKVYYPIYRIFSTLTLSVLYRSIYYNLISRFSKPLLRVVLLTYIALVIFTPFFKLDSYSYYPDNRSEHHLSYAVYDDQRPEDEYITTASIPSMKVEDSFIALFIRYNPSDNSAIMASCPGFEPAKQSGWQHGIVLKDGNLRLNDPDVDEPLPASALKCLVDYYTIDINGLPAAPDRSYFYTHPNREEKGIMLYLDVANLATGTHSLVVKKQILQDSVLNTTDYANIAFWKQ